MAQGGLGGGVADGRDGRSEMGGASVMGGDIGGGQPWEGGGVLVQVATLAGQQPPAVFQRQHLYDSQPDCRT